MSEEALNETKNSICMPVQEYNGPGVITMENLGETRKLWQSPAITLVCFPEFVCTQFLHHIQELRKHTNPLHNLIKSFHTGRWKLGCGKMFNSLTVQEKPH
jgi:hypothetical protein